MIVKANTDYRCNTCLGLTPRSNTTIIEVNSRSTETSCEFDPPERVHLSSGDLSKSESGRSLPCHLHYFHSLRIAVCRLIVNCIWGSERPCTVASKKLTDAVQKEMGCRPPENSLLKKRLNSTQKSFAS